MELPSHGANALALYEQLNIPIPEKIYDLSENVNVLGSPASIKELWPKLIDQIGIYPHQLAEPFRTKVAVFHEIANHYVVVGNGAAEILMAIATLFRNKRAILIEPSFSEYRRTLSMHDVTIKEIIVSDICTYSLPIHLIKEAMNDADVLYLCNPNNPTGVLTKRHVIEQLLQYGQKVHCAIVVDEAFMDWTDEQESVISLVPHYENLFVLRSMTKMYALAGVRLGYCISQQAQSIRAFLPHWSVSQMAIELGCLCLNETAFVQQSRNESKKMLEKINEFLTSYQCKVTDSCTNYVTFQPPKEWRIREMYLSFLQEGIVLRHTENFRGLEGKWFRIGMKNEQTMQFFMKRFEHYANNLHHTSWRNRVE